MSTFWELPKKVAFGDEVLSLDQLIDRLKESLSRVDSRQSAKIAQLLSDLIQEGSTPERHADASAYSQNLALAIKALFTARDLLDVCNRQAISLRWVYEAGRIHAMGEYIQDCTNKLAVWREPLPK